MNPNLRARFAHLADETPRQLCCRATEAWRHIRDIQAAHGGERSPWEWEPTIRLNETLNELRLRVADGQPDGRTT